MLPGIDGLNICKAIRKEFSGCILMLTAKDRASDQISGLDQGADDYVTKPVDPNVLLARIKALLRRAQNKLAQKQEKLSIGQLFIDLISQQVYLAAQPIDLKPKEYQLLELLAQNAGKILSRNTITQCLRGIDYDGIDRSIDLRISSLRKKLNDDAKKPIKIKTIHSKGYVLIPESWA